MNKFPGLTWEFSELSTSIDFMDMTITINKSNKIETTLFEKKLNLHLYVPPPPPLYPPTRVTPRDRVQHTVSNFYPMFIRKRQIAINKGFFQMSYCSRIQRRQDLEDDADHNHVILHLPFHPNDPASFCIQEAWHTHVAKPQWKMPLEHMKNPKTKEQCNIKRMINAYKMNLGNLLSH